MLGRFFNKVDQAQKCQVMEYLKLLDNPITEITQDNLKLQPLGSKFC